MPEGWLSQKRHPLADVLLVRRHIGTCTRQGLPRMLDGDKP